MKLLHTLAFLVLICAVLARPNAEKEKDDDYAAYGTASSDDDNVQNDEDYEVSEEGEGREPDEDGPPPTIQSAPLHITTDVGDEVQLPCKAENADRFVVFWYHNKDLLYQDSIAIGTSNEEHFKRDSDRTLRIFNVTADQSGVYTCSITGSNKEKIEVNHTVQVRTPATIISVTAGNNITTIEGGKTLVLKCVAAGVPEPKITWSKGGFRLHSHGDTSTITIDNISHDRAGTYQCMAENGVAQPAHKHILIRVTHKPNVKIEKLTVNSAEDYESVLTCIVHAEPKASVLWQKDGRNIVHSQNIQLTHMANKHTLTILKTKTSDFGNYTCSAANHLGRTEAVVVLTGTPSPAEFVGGDTADEKNPVLTWTVESNSPVTEYKLQYRKAKTTEWIDEKPEVTNPEGNIYTVKHTLLGLEPAPYETRMKSKNNYGWSPYSKIHHFNGEKQDDLSMNVMEQAEDPRANTTGGAINLTMSLYLLIASFVLINRCI